MNGLTERAAQIGFDDYAYRASPVTFWDLFGQQGHPVRTTVAEMGPLLLARLLELSGPQEGILNIAFRIADEDAMPLLDLKDLQALLVPQIEVIFDIDKFKVYNDVYGFEKGDEVIRALARTLIKFVREIGGPNAFVGHIGGDVF